MKPTLTILLGLALALAGCVHIRTKPARRYESPKGREARLSMRKLSSPPMPTPSKAIPRAVIVPPKPITNIVLIFKTNPSDAYWNNEWVYQIAWATNLATCAHSVSTKKPITNDFNALPWGWRHYAWSKSQTNSFGLTNRQAYFICRPSNTVTKAVGKWNKL